jgi:hypothetical protein
MGDAAVDVDAPVNTRGAHLGLERQTMLQGDKGVLDANGDQHLADDVGRILGPGGVEPRVKRNHRLDIRTGAGKLQHQGAAEAVADGRHL